MLKPEMTQAEAMMWLAEQTKPCPDTEHIGAQCKYGCGLTGKVPLLDLREPCSGFCKGCGTYQTTHSLLFHTTILILLGGKEQFTITCPDCGGTGWVAKQGRDALHEAMHKAGLRSKVYAHAGPPDDGMRLVIFYRPDSGDSHGPMMGEDADDWLAAVKAVKALRAVGT